jgi:hypothetical protein
VQVHYDEEVANRIDPESCADAHEGISEARSAPRSYPTAGGAMKIASLPLQCKFAAPHMSSIGVRPEGANHQWRKTPPGELSIDPVADERLVPGRAVARCRDFSV